MYSWAVIAIDLQEGSFTVQIFRLVVNQYTYLIAGPF